MATVSVSVRDARNEDRAWIQRVYREYLIDLAPSATGIYPMLPEAVQREPEEWARFFDDARAHVLTVCYEERPVGFAKIGTGAGVAARQYSLAEFFIGRAWRRRGIGAEAVRLILDRFEGSWLITEHLGNEPAVRFWRHVVSAYTAGRYQERIVNGEVHQRFESRRRRPSGP